MEATKVNSANARALRESNLVTGFRLAANSMVAELVEAIAAAGYRGIRPAHSRVFENLASDGSSLAELAKRAQVTHQSMSELVAGLEELGYLERRPNPDDNRAKLVCLTASGRALMRIALKEIARIEAAWLDKLHGEGIRGDLRSALQKLLGAD